MYYRTTKNRLLASILLLAIVMLIPANKSVLADTHLSGSFSPWKSIGGVVSDYDGIDLIQITPSSDAHERLPSDDGTLNTNNKILIYHTHTNEAYLKTDENRFANLASRSQDESITVKKAGEALQNAFAVFGVDSDHDVSNNEAQGYNNAYKMSAAAVNGMIEENGDYLAYIDVHRDAYVNNTEPTVTIDYESVARIMLVVGGASYRPEQNYAFALKVSEELNKIHPQLCEKVLYVKTSAYHKIECDNCLIVEIGDNAVTVEEACNAAKYVAMAISKVLSEERDENYLNAF